jgi:hypothetical protein
MIKHVKAGDQLTYIFIKAFSCDKFMYLRELLEIINKNIKGVIKLIIFYFLCFVFFLCWS